MAIHSILRMGDPRLLQMAQPVTDQELGSSALDQLIIDLFDTMHAYKGAGIAAPQIGVSLRVFTWNIDDDIVAGDIFFIDQRIEGYNIADLGWGTASASSVTISFWVRSSLTGTFGGALGNSATNRSYPFTYTISSANTWEQKTVTIAGDTSGTWLTTNGIGIRVYFGLGAGTSVSGTAGSWAGTEYRSATGGTNVMATNGATFYITGVQLEAGSAASPFENRLYTTELQLCQRYFVRLGGTASYTPFGAGLWRNSTTPNFIIPLPVSMRTTPTCTISSASNFFVSNGASNVTPSAIALDQGSPLALMVDATYSSGTTGQGTRLFAANTTAATIDSSAEL